MKDPRLTGFARGRGMTAAQAAIAWLLSKEDVMVIPKTSRRQRLVENLGALEHALGPEELAELDRLFPPPTGPAPLDML